MSDTDQKNNTKEKEGNVVQKAPTAKMKTPEKPLTALQNHLKTKKTLQAEIFVRMLPPGVQFKKNRKVYAIAGITPAGRRVSMDCTEECFNRMGRPILGQVPTNLDFLNGARFVVYTHPTTKVAHYVDVIKPKVYRSNTPPEHLLKVDKVTIELTNGNFTVEEAPFNTPIGDLASLCVGLSRLDDIQAGAVYPINWLIKKCHVESFVGKKIVIPAKTDQATGESVDYGRTPGSNNALNIADFH